ncbi:MAG: SDR family oxidoreductase [Gemmatimonadota bacterium]|nr:SDR family oxidoreductase [Gemmatimonadota bacterium]
MIVAPKRILLTGATGNLGALMCLRLLDEGHTVVCLVRGRGSRDFTAKRVRKALGLLDSSIDRRTWAGTLLVLRADISVPEELVGVDLGGRIDETWHFASSLKFMPRDRDEIFDANVGGLTNILALHRRAARPGAPFYYASTAYLAGKGTHFVPEAEIESGDDLGFRNEYERSKLEAEHLFFSAHRNGEITGAVFRPSIVVGMRGTGALVNHNGYYLALEAWLRLSQYAESVGAAGEQVRLWVDPGHRLNLVPLDSAIDAMQSVRSAGVLDGTVFNLVNDEELTVEYLLASLGRYLSIQPMACGDSYEEGTRKTTYEKLAAYGLTYTSPYMKHWVRFETGNLQRATGSGLSVQLYPDEIERLHSAYFNPRGRVQLGTDKAPEVARS